MRRLAALVVLLAITLSLCSVGVLQASERHRCCDSEEASCPLLSAAMTCCTGQPGEVAPFATPATPAPTKTSVASTASALFDLATATALAASPATTAPHGLHALPPLLKTCLRRI